MGDKYDLKVVEKADHAPIPERHYPGPINGSRRSIAASPSRLQRALIRAKRTVGPVGDRGAPEGDARRAQLSACASGFGLSADPGELTGFDKDGPIPAKARSMSRIRRTMARASVRLGDGEAHGEATRAALGSSFISIQRADSEDVSDDEFYKKYDDKWWPKTCRTSGPYKDLNPEGYGQVNSRGEFGKKRAIIIAANKARNGGKLMSDAPGDPHKELTETPGLDNSAEVDHVIPNVNGGSNHWWNARVISRKLNNSLERVVEAKSKKF